MSDQRQPERPPIDPSLIGLLIIAVALFVFFVVRYYHVIPWSAR